MQLPAPANRGFVILFCRQSGEFAMQIGLIRAIDAHAPLLKLSGVFARDLPGATIRLKLAVASGANGGARGYSELCPFASAAHSREPIYLSKY
jgi:hypothetical protein